MKRIALVMVLIYLCSLVLASCGNTHHVPEINGNESSLEVESTEESAKDKNAVMEYFKQNGSADGDSYAIQTMLIDEMPATWTLSEKKPDRVNCHATIDNSMDCYFRYYLSDRIISYNFDLYGTLGSEKKTYSTYGLVDEAAYHEGDELAISELLLDGEIDDISNFGGGETFNANVTFLIPAFCKQLKDFGLQEESTNGGDKTRSETQMVELLPADDEYKKLFYSDDAHNLTSNEESVGESLIPEKYANDASSLDIYKAVKRGETDYLLTLLGEADTITNVTNNSFSNYIKNLLDEMGFYNATTLQQNFLELYAVLGNNDAKKIDDEIIKAVYVSGYSEDGSGNTDNIINPRYVVARCIVVQTDQDKWYLFTNQEVGSNNAYAKEKVSMINAPQVVDGQFKLEGWDIKFTFTKEEDSFFKLETAMKAYQLGQLLKEFNTEYVSPWNEYYQEKESAKYEPGIGMTKQEVLNSSWGSPEEINTMDSKYGNHHEQWVYGNNRYVYFDDGVVTAIQDNGKEIY